jgi:serine protease Do
MKLAPLTPERARQVGVERTLRGLVVTEVDPEGPTAGIVRPGDVIVEVNRQRVTGLDEFQRAASRGAGKQTLLLIQRGPGQMFVVIDK